MDLVYITSPNSNCNDLELRYSIRSMVKHLEGFKRIVIVGHKPDFLNDVIHIPAEDPYIFNPARNIFDKIMVACRHPKISKNFICCSDDYFLLENFSAAAFPYYHCGELSHQLGRVSPTNFYRPHLENTITALTAKGLPTFNYNVHCPIVYNKALFKSLASFNWDIKKGYVSKSLYANSLKEIDNVKIDDCKIHTPKTKSAIYRRLKGEIFFSTNEHSIGGGMPEVLEELFPEPSRWEIL